MLDVNWDICAAFIAVIVCLILVIIVSCVAIFFLLRDQKAFDEEQARRGKQNRYEGTSEVSSYKFRGTSARRPWSVRLAALFRRRDTQYKTRPRIIDRARLNDGGGTHRWMQAGSTDHWESEIDSRSMGVQEASTLPSPPSLYPAPSDISSIPVSWTISDSTSSVRFDLQPTRSYLYLEAHPSPQSTLPSIHSQLSSPSYSRTSSPVPLRSLSLESIPRRISLDNDSRHYVTPSGIVMRTLPGGTKFIEEL
ncbi:hypothetical protein D9615_002013 [Tricholomella constricta]|uniref:Uncharacterized protein n=1 Tax=Tricholomella constricta TaxID=117010 RepID=A0A8H5HP05_9AGAR|nr:hypothetical protein D9615_002013 [Tricholomella constricta]